MKFHKIILVTFTLLTSLILLELGLQLLTPVLIYSPLANQSYDYKLGSTMDPSLKDIDENGFRNPISLHQADIVALGDSHTYGFNVSSEESWPQQLAIMAGMTVYNFGVGTYGSLQYGYLIDDAVKLKPKHIIIGLYVANDLDDVCKLITKTDYWNGWVEKHGFDVETCFKSFHWFDRVKQYLSELHLYWMAASAVKRLYERTDLGDSLVVREEMNATIIKYNRIASHKQMMDMERERISLGYEITMEIIKDIKRKSDMHGINFGIVFIPSKERAYFDYLTGSGYRLPDDYYQLLDYENKLIEKFSRVFDEWGIKYIDAEPYVQGELYKSGRVYPPTDDGHPLETGYKAYAEAVYNCMIKENKNVVGNKCNRPKP